MNLPTREYRISCTGTVRAAAQATVRPGLGHHWPLETTATVPQERGARGENATSQGSSAGDKGRIGPARGMNQ